MCAADLPPRPAPVPPGALWLSAVEGALVGAVASRGGEWVSTRGGAECIV